MEGVPHSQKSDYPKGKDGKDKFLPPVLLSDQPVSEDRFGIHRQIAEQLDWLIEKITYSGSNHKRKNVIGLFGTWGSGKSTVIKIFKNLTKDKFEVIDYDSWSLKDEHLKKAFLLQIIKFLKMNDIKYNNENELNKDKKVTLEDVILGKVKEQTITRKPSTADINFWLFLVGFILFLGAVSSSLYEIGKLFLSDFFNSFVFPLMSFDNLKILSIIQFFSLLGFPLLFLLLWRKRKKIMWKLLSPFLSIPISVSENITSFGQVEIPSLQFQEYFRFIVSKWTENKKNRIKTLVIVLDNMDRVSDEIVSRFFSLIQSALDALKYTNFQEKVVFIVPIDKDRVLQVLGKMIQYERTNGTAFSESTSFNEDFLKKLFPYAVEIPDLIDSNWRVFFKTKLLEVFPQVKIATAESSLITGIFHWGIIQKTHHITPREMIHFINEMALNAWMYQSIKSQVTPQENTRELSSTDIVLIALYTAIKRYDSNWFKELFEHDKPNGKEFGPNKNYKTILETMVTPYIGIIIPESFNINILQLHYRTKDVWDLLFSGPLQDILEEGGEKSIKIIENHIQLKLANLSSAQRHIILKEILEKTLQENITDFSMSPVKIGRFIWILQNLNLYDRGFGKQLWALFKKSVQRKSLDLKTMDVTAKKGILYILSQDFPEKYEVVKNLSKHFIRLLDNLDDIMEDSE